MLNKKQILLGGIMKKLFLILILLLSFIVVSCDDGGSDTKTDNDPATDTDSNPTGDDDTITNPDNETDNDNIPSGSLKCYSDEISPEYGSRQVSVELEKLSWKACDNATMYDVFITDGTTEVQLASDIETTEVNLANSLQPSTTYWWYVVAKNNVGNTYNTQPFTWWFETAATPTPVCSNLEISPRNGKEQIPTDSSFSWGACTSQTEASITYDLYICDKGETCIVDTSYFVKAASDLTEREYTPETLKSSTTYYWYIVAKDENGETSTFYEKWHFTTSTPGAFLWSYSVTDDGFISQIAVDDNEVIYVGGYEGNLYAINKDGTEKWKYTSNSAFLLGDIKRIKYTAVGSDGTVFLQHDITPYDQNRSYIAAINSENGTEKWNRAYHSIYSNPAFADGKIAMIVKNQTDTSTKYELVSVQESDGQELISTWPAGKTNELNALYFSYSYVAFGNDQTVYVPMKHIYQPNIGIGITDEAYDHKKQDVGAFDTSYDLVWKHSYEGTNTDTDIQNIRADGDSSAYQKNIAIDGSGNLYFVAGNQGDYGTNGRQNLYKLDKTTGEVLWVWKSGKAYSNMSTNGIVIDNDNTAYAVIDDTLFAIDTTNGTTKWSKSDILPDATDTNFTASVIVIGTGDIFVGIRGTQQGGMISDAVVISKTDQSILWKYNDIATKYIYPETISITKSGILLLYASNESGWNGTVDAYDFTSFGGAQTDAAWPIIGQNPQRTYQAK